MISHFIVEYTNFDVLAVDYISAPDFDLAPAAFESKTANDVSLESAGDCRFFCSSCLTGRATPCISAKCFTP